MRLCARHLDFRQLPLLPAGFQRGLCPGRGIEPGQENVHQFMAGFRLRAMHSTYHPNPKAGSSPRGHDRAIEALSWPCRVAARVGPPSPPSPRKKPRQWNSLRLTILTGNDHSPIFSGAAIAEHCALAMSTLLSVRAPKGYLPDQTAMRGMPEAPRQLAEMAGQLFMGRSRPSVRITLLIAGTACLAHGFAVPIE